MEYGVAASWWGLHCTTHSVWHTRVGLRTGTLESRAIEISIVIVESILLYVEFRPLRTERKELYSYSFWRNLPRNSAFMLGNFNCVLRHLLNCRGHHRSFWHEIPAIKNFSDHDNWKLPVCCATARSTRRPTALRAIWRIGMALEQAVSNFTVPRIWRISLNYLLCAHHRICQIIKKWSIVFMDGARPLPQ